eukprot:Pgem_evm1s11168
MIEMTAEQELKASRWKQLEPDEIITSCLTLVIDRYLDVFMPQDNTNNNNNVVSNINSKSSDVIYKNQDYDQNTTIINEIFNTKQFHFHNNSNNNINSNNSNNDNNNNNN